MPAEVEDHLPPVEHRIADQPDAMEQEQAEELAESGEDVLSDITLTEKQMNNVQETEVLGAPGLAENSESVEAELPVPVVTRSGRTGKILKRYRDYVCCEVKNDVTQELGLSVGIHLIPDVDVSGDGKLSLLAAALDYQPQREIQSFVTKQRSSEVNYKMDPRSYIDRDVKTRDDQRTEYGSM